MPKKPRRLDAIQTCKDRGFFLGDVLVSDHWKKPRRIVAFAKKAVLYKIGDRMDLMETVPEDVRRQDML